LTAPAVLRRNKVDVPQRQPGEPPILRRMPCPARGMGAGGDRPCSGSLCTYGAPKAV